MKLFCQFQSWFDQKNIIELFHQYLVFILVKSNVEWVWSSRIQPVVGWCMMSPLWAQGKTRITTISVAAAVSLYWNKKGPITELYRRNTMSCYTKFLLWTQSSFSIQKPLYFLYGTSTVQVQYGYLYLVPNNLWVPGTCISLWAVKSQADAKNNIINWTEGLFPESTGFKLCRNSRFTM